MNRHGARSLARIHSWAQPPPYRRPFVSLSGEVWGSSDVTTPLSVPGGTRDASVVMNL